MARYIDADLLLKKVNELEVNALVRKESYVELYANLVKAVKEFPAADVVEVVRCKDCRNRFEKNWAKCHGRKPDDFCSDGIRRWK